MTKHVREWASSDGRTIGREPEWERITSLIDRLVDGPVVVLIEGNAGIGKSTLLDASADYAQRLGVRVVQVSAAQSRVRSDFRDVIGLFGSLEPATVDSLPPAQRRALRIALRWDEPDQRPIERETVAAAIAGALRRVAREGPVLLAIDDLHRIEDSTRPALEFAMRRVHPLPVGVIATARTTEGARPRPMERAVDPARLFRISLGPLSEGAIRQILVRRTTPRFSRRDVERITVATQGNPGLALEIARLLPEGSPVGTGALGGLPVPESVRALVAERLGGLPFAARALLVRIAVAGVPIRPDDERVARAVERVGIAHVNPDGLVGFAHRLYESALYASIPPDERRRLHAIFAATVTEVEGRARHLALGATGPDETTAAAIMRGCDAAIARGAAPAAADLAEVAWNLTPHDCEHVLPRALAAAHHHLSAGSVMDAIRIVDQVWPTLTGVLRGRALTIKGDALMWGQSFSGAVRIFESALPFFADDPASEALTHVALAFGHFQLGSDREIVRRHADEAIRAATRAGAPGPTAVAQAVHAMIGWLFGEGVAGADLHAGLADDGDYPFVAVQFRPRVIWATIAGYSDEIERGVAVFRSEFRRAATSGACADLPYLATHAITLAALHGDALLMDEVISRLAVGDEAADAGSVGVAGPLGAMSRAVRLGDFAQARVLGAQALARVNWRRATLVATRMAGALGELELALGNYRRSLDSLGSLESETRHTGPADPATQWAFADFCEALVGVGELTVAREKIDEYEHRSVELGRIWTQGAIRRARAALLAEEGDLAGAVGEAHASIAILEGSGYTVHLGRAYLTLGILERRRRRRAASRAALERAREIFVAAQTRLWEDRARQELERSWRPRDPHRLSQNEVRIAQLAADGWSNPQIAQELVCSRRAVEAALSRVYRKVGIHGRAEIATALGPSPTSSRTVNVWTSPISSPPIAG